MDQYYEFRQNIRNFIGSNPTPSPSDAVDFLKQLEDNALDFFLSMNRTADDLRSQLVKKSDDMITILKQRIELVDQLNVMKDSTQKMIKYYNMSIKAASHTIARTVIEMVIREHVQGVCFSVEKLMYEFRTQKQYSVSDSS